MGGIAGAIDHAAERAVAGLAATEIGALPELLRRLVAPIYRSTPSVSSGAPLALRIAKLAELDAPARRLVDGLVNARLLVHSIERGVPMIRLAHLELLEHWQRARALAASDFRVVRPGISRQPARWRKRFSAAAAAMLATFAVLAGWHSFEARRAQQTAEQSQRTALAERDHADRQRGIAERREQEALELRQQAEARGNQALELARLAEAGRQEALERARLAEAGQEALKRAGRTAEEAGALAQERQQAADARVREAGQRARVAQSRLLAALADQKYRAGDHVTAVLLALESFSHESHGDRPLEAERSLEHALRSWGDERVPREKWILGGARGPVLACALGRDGLRVAIGTADGTVQLWDAETGAAIVQLDGQSEDLAHVSFDAEATKVVSAAADGLRIRDASTGALIAWFPEKRSVLAVSPDAQWVVSSSAPNRLHLWETGTGREIVKTVPGTVLAVRFGTDGARVLVAAPGGSIELYEAISGRWLRFFRGHARKVLSASFSPDGQRIASLGDDQTARVWSTANGRQLFRVHDQTLKPALAVGLTNEHVLIPFSLGFRLYAIQAGKLIAELPVDDEISIALVSPDGKYVVTAPSAPGDARSPKQAKLWDAASGKPLAMLQEGAATTCAGVSQDGRTLLTGDRDGVGRLWSFERTAAAPSAATLAAMIEFSKTHVPRCLTRGQRESASLEIEPPAWCIEMAKWPYQTQAWRDWLRYKRENAGPPLPDTPEWRAWLAYRTVAPSEQGPPK